MNIVYTRKTEMIKKRNHNFINSENVLTVFSKEKLPLSVNGIYKRFAKNQAEKKAIKRILRNLVQKGALVKLKNNLLGIPSEMNLVTGKLLCTKSGNGFVIPANGKMRDVFVPARFMGGAFHGDEVVARVSHTYRGRKEGKIIRITSRNTYIITGYTMLRDTLYIIPEDKRYNSVFSVINKSRKEKVGDGVLAAARITQFSRSGENPQCDIIKVFDDGLKDVNTVTHFIECKYSLATRFRRSIESEAARLGAPSENMPRQDLRKLKHITIDGELARDFDDAVCIEKVDHGWRLYVSIADVSAYVRTGMSLDAEAYERGTSIYFPGRVLPMLPKRLSNELCSINPAEDKLAQTVTIEFSHNGDILKTFFSNSIIRSTRRLTYREVEHAVIQRDRSARKNLRGIVTMLDQMAELASLLHEQRLHRGSLDFDLPEPEVILDIEGGIKTIIRAERLFSHQLIEEFMIAANEAVARFLRDNKKPALYRIHEPPDREKLRDIEKLMRTVSLDCKVSVKDGNFLRSILKSAKGTEYEFFINKVLLRSMKQARYSPINKGHFGLASDCYLHFTSPIRRYPDLVCHRSLKYGPNDLNLPEEEWERMANHLSDRERIAMEAERELEDRIRILFMKNKVGNIYQGIISRVTSFGFFVEIDEVFVEGLVLLADLANDYYHFEEDKLRLIGRKTRKIYRIGDQIKIKVTFAEVETNRLHFTPV